MSERSPGIVLDGFTAVDMGMDSGRNPLRLPINQVSGLINATTRGEFITQRPGFKRHTLRFVDAGGEPDPTLATNFKTKRFQHGSWYKPDTGPSCLMAAVAGRIFKININTDKSVQDISPGTSNPFLGMGWSVQAECFWTYQDNQSLPIIFDGASARYANPDEIKTGNVMAYVQGRIWYGLPGGFSFRAGDIVYGASGTATYRYRDAVLKETENTFLNEGGDFAIPQNSGEIRAMLPFANLDTSMGQGPLQVFAENSVFSVNTPTDRNVWKDVQYPIQTTSLLADGAQNQQGTIAVNGDIFFRGTGTNIWSFIIARREFRQWGNTPQSFEMHDVLSYDQQNLLKYGSAAVFDNRQIRTVSPAYTDHGIIHRGLVVMDLSPVSSLLAEHQPVWEGIWTGVRVLSLVKTDTGCYMFVLNQDDEIEVWEITKDELFDAESVRVQWSVNTRSLYASDQFNLKELQSADLAYDRIAGTVDFQARWRPDQWPCWIDWKDWTECAQICSEVPDCPIQPMFQKGYQPKYRLPDPPEACINGRQQTLFFSTQVQLEITGPCRLLGFRTKALVQEEETENPNCEDAACAVIRCCDQDPFKYSSEPETE